MDKDFPVKGLDENWAYKAQPEGTTPACLNVRPYDATGQRLRGGQRAGLSKWIATQPNGTNPIQRMGYLPPQSVGGSFADGAGACDLWKQPDGDAGERS
jgi:hypothetical protein